jgi:hypothetical protein
MAASHPPARALTSAGAFSDLCAELCAWGQWGADDSRGALSYIRPGHVGRAAGLVTSSRTAGLGLPLDTSTGPDDPSPVVHQMTGLPAAYPTDATAFKSSPRVTDATAFKSSPRVTDATAFKSSPRVRKTAWP